MSAELEARALRMGAVAFVTLTKPSSVGCCQGNPAKLAEQAGLTRPRADIGATRYLRSDGTVVRALQFDGRIAGFSALLQAFPDRIAAHPLRDDAALVIMANGRRVRIEAGDWVVEQPDGSMQTYPADQFNLLHSIVEAIAA